MAAKPKARAEGIVCPRCGRTLPVREFDSLVAGSPPCKTCKACRMAGGRGRDGDRHSRPTPVPRAPFPLERNAQLCPMDARLW